MALINWKDLPNTDTPLNAQNLNFNFNEVLNLIYPVGRVIIDETDTDYSNYLGFTWEKTLVGVVPVGKDATQTEFDTLGETGGEKTHTLNMNELPNKNFILNEAGRIYVNTSSSQTINCRYGGGQAHNNLQPYQVVNYWKRVA